MCSGCVARGAARSRKLQVPQEQFRNTNVRVLSKSSTARGITRLTFEKTHQALDTILKQIVRLSQHLLA